MSRHFFDCELRCNVRIRLGYDRPLRVFFFEIEVLNPGMESDLSPFIYASLDDPHDAEHDLDYYREKLKLLGLTVPSSLFKAVVDDAANNVGNRCVQHFADGRMVENTPN